MGSQRTLDLKHKFQIGSRRVSRCTYNTLSGIDANTYHGNISKRIECTQTRNAIAGWEKDFSETRTRPEANRHFRFHKHARKCKRYNDLIRFWLLRRKSFTLGTHQINFKSPPPSRLILASDHATIATEPLLFLSQPQPKPKAACSVLELMKQFRSNRVITSSWSTITRTRSRPWTNPVDR